MDIKILPLPRKPKNKPIPKTKKRRGGSSHDRHKCDYCVAGMNHKHKKKIKGSNQEVEEFVACNCGEDT